jgi:hypothetical protein
MSPSLGFEEGPSPFVSHKVAQDKLAPIKKERKKTNPLKSKTLILIQDRNFQPRIWVQN